MSCRVAHQLHSKLPFDVHAVVERLREAVRPLPMAAMFQLADEGFDSPFEQLVACIISIRTLEETTLPTARRLFAAARTPAEVAALDPAEIDGFVGRDMRFEFRDRRLDFTAEDFLLSFAQPNFYFHASIAYAILRAQGFGIGKGDFIGRARIKR